MNLTDLSTRQWPSVAVAVALVALFGLVSIASLPIQLLPTIEEPQISVSNFWRAAALGVQVNDIIATVSRATDSSGGRRPRQRGMHSGRMHIELCRRQLVQS